MNFSGLCNCCWLFVTPTQEQTTVEFLLLPQRWYFLFTVARNSVLRTTWRRKMKNPCGHKRALSYRPVNLTGILNGMYRPRRQARTVSSNKQTHANSGTTLRNKYHGRTLLTYRGPVEGLPTDSCLVEIWCFRARVQSRRSMPALSHRWPHLFLSNVLTVSQLDYKPSKTYFVIGP